MAVLVRSATGRLDGAPHTGMVAYDPAAPRIPAAAVATLDAEWLSARLAEAPGLRLRLRLDGRSEGTVEAPIVVGQWDGTELPAEVVVLGAHLDAWDLGTGAHDDGAGCAQAIEAVRILKALGLRPKRSLRVVLYPDEEYGASAGRVYAASPRRRERAASSRPWNPTAAASSRSASGSGSEASFERLEGLGAAAPRCAASNGSAPAEEDRTSARWPRRGRSSWASIPDSQRYFDYHHSANDVLSAVHPRELELGAVVQAVMALRRGPGRDLNHAAGHPLALPPADLQDGPGGRDYVLPWVNVHTTKNYWPMARLARGMRLAHVRYNFVPCLLEQMDDYERGLAIGSLGRTLSKRIPPDRLGPIERPRAPPPTSAPGDGQSVRLVQEMALRRSSSRRSIRLPAGREATARPQARDPAARPLPRWPRALRRTAWTELTASAYYHPILPMLCDSPIRPARRARPRPTFRHPLDASYQLRRGTRLLHSRNGPASGRDVAVRGRGQPPGRPAPPRRRASASSSRTRTSCGEASAVPANSPGDLYRPYLAGVDRRSSSGTASFPT